MKASPLSSEEDVEGGGDGSSRTTTREILLTDEEGNVSVKEDEKGYKDPFFAFCFVIEFLLVVSLGLSFGIKALSQGSSTFVSISAASTKEERPNNTHAILLGGLFVLTITSSCMAILWTFLLAHSGRHLVNVSIIAILSVLGVAGTTFFASGAVLGGVSLLVLALFVFGFYLLLRPRIALASVLLEISCKAVLDMGPPMYLFGLAMLVTQGFYCLCWALAVIGFATNEGVSEIAFKGNTYKASSCATYSYSTPTYALSPTSVLYCKEGKSCTACVCNGNVIVSPSSSCFQGQIYYGKYIVLLLLLFWGCEVLGNLVHVSAAKAVSLWWADKDTRAHTHAKTGIKRALTTSLGSVALGSLLVAFIQTARVCVASSIATLDLIDDSISSSSSSSSSSNSSALASVSSFCTRMQRGTRSCLAYVLRQLDAALRYFNRYAFVFVGIYGVSWLEASQSVIALWTKLGWTTLVNDDITESILFFAHTMISSSMLLISYAYTRTLGLHTQSSEAILLLLLAVLSGYASSRLVLRTVSSASSTIYVLWGQSPQAFEEARPNEFLKLNTAWCIGGIGGNGTSRSSAEGGCEPYVPEKSSPSHSLSQAHTNTQTHTQTRTFIIEEENDSAGYTPPTLHDDGSGYAKLPTAANEDEEAPTKK